LMPTGGGTWIACGLDAEQASRSWGEKRQWVALAGSGTWRLGTGTEGTALHSWDAVYFGAQAGWKEGRRDGGQPDSRQGAGWETKRRKTLRERMQMRPVVEGVAPKEAKMTGTVWHANSQRLGPTEEKAETNIKCGVRCRAPRTSGGHGSSTATAQSSVCLHGAAAGALAGACNNSIVLTCTQHVLLGKRASNMPAAAHHFTPAPSGPPPGRGAALRPGTAAPNQSCCWRC